MPDAQSKLKIIIEADDKGLKSIEGGLADVGNSIKSIVNEYKVYAVAIAAVGAALTANAMLFAKASMEMRDLSYVTGFSIDTLTKLKYAADLTGTSFSAIQTSVMFMSRSLREAQSPTSEMAKSLHELGLSARELKSSTPEEIFFTLANALAGVADPLERNALAMQIFGRGAVEIIPFLDDLNRAMQEASGHAAFFSDEDRENARIAQESFVQMKAAWDKLMGALAISTFPALTAIFNGITAILNAIDNFSRNTVAMSLLWALLGAAGGAMIGGLPGAIIGTGLGVGAGLLTGGIPRMAQGGIATRPTLSMVGESGPEAIVPLDKLGGMTVVVNVSGSVMSERDLAEVVREAFYQVKNNNLSLGLA